MATNQNSTQGVEESSGPTGAQKGDQREKKSAAEKAAGAKRYRWRWWGRFSARYQRL
jgi:hypothetical protein